MYVCGDRRPEAIDGREEKKDEVDADHDYDHQNLDADQECMRSERQPLLPINLNSLTWFVMYAFTGIQDGDAGD